MSIPADEFLFYLSRLCHQIHTEGSAIVYTLVEGDRLVVSEPWTTWMDFFAGVHLPDTPTVVLARALAQATIVVESESLRVGPTIQLSISHSETLSEAIQRVLKRQPKEHSNDELEQLWKTRGQPKDTASLTTTTIKQVPIKAATPLARKPKRRGLVYASAPSGSKMDDKAS